MAVVVCAPCRWFFQQLILAVDYCHKKGVANRDIKLENTLLAVSPKHFLLSLLETLSAAPALGTPPPLFFSIATCC